MVVFQSMLESFHTAEYQYIRALALPKQDELNLKLNNAPSFHKPMSVPVIGLSTAEAAPLPPLRPVNPNECPACRSLLWCFRSWELLWFFPRVFAHDFVFQGKSKSGQGVDLPATADPARGGFVIDTRKLRAAALDADASGTPRGYWGC